MTDEELLELDRWTAGFMGWHQVGGDLWVDAEQVAHSMRWHGIFVSDLNMAWKAAQKWKGDGLPGARKISLVDGWDNPVPRATCQDFDAGQRGVGADQCPAVALCLAVRQFEDRRA